MAARQHTFLCSRNHSCSLDDAETILRVARTPWSGLGLQAVFCQLLSKCLKSPCRVKEDRGVMRCVSNYFWHTQKPNLKPVDLNQCSPMSDVPSNSMFFQLQLNCPKCELGSQDLVYPKTVV